jgi:hypothetical protein
MTKISNNINYITDFACTYQLISEVEDSDLLYQLQLLQAFDLEQFDDDRINCITEQLYEKYKENECIKKLMNSNNVIQSYFPDKVSQFRAYFGYNTFYLLHNLICNLTNNK